MLAQARSSSGYPGQIQRRRLRSRRTEERPKKKGAVQGLWQKDKAQVSVVEYWIDAGGCQSRLRRAQRHPSLSCLRSIVASSGVARPFCRRHSSHQGGLPLDVYRYAYHVFIQAGVVAQGLLQYLAVVAPKLVWASFGSWLRTIRPGIPPSEFVVADALRHMLPDFLLGSTKNGSLAEFIANRQDTTSMQGFRLAS